MATRGMGKGRPCRRGRFYISTVVSLPHKKGDCENAGEFFTFVLTQLPHGPTERGGFTPRLPRKLRPLVLAAIAYFILPVDNIPEELEGTYGYVDDIWLCAFVVQRVMQEIGTPEVLETHWDGEGDVVRLVEEIVNQENILSKDQCERVLLYIGCDY